MNSSSSHLPDSTPHHEALSRWLTRGSSLSSLIQTAWLDCRLLVSKLSGLCIVLIAAILYTLVEPHCTTVHGRPCTVTGVAPLSWFVAATSVPVRQRENHVLRPTLRRCRRACVDTRSRTHALVGRSLRARSATSNWRRSSSCASSSSARAPGSRLTGQRNASSRTVEPANLPSPGSRASEEREDIVRSAQEA